MHIFFNSFKQGIYVNVFIYTYWTALKYKLGREKGNKYKNYTNNFILFFSPIHQHRANQWQISCFKCTFNGILQFVTSWKIMKILMIHPAVRCIFIFRPTLFIQWCHHGCVKRRTLPEDCFARYRTSGITVQKHNFITFFSDLSETGSCFMVKNVSRFPSVAHGLLCLKQLWTDSFPCC